VVVSEVRDFDADESIGENPGDQRNPIPHEAETPVAPGFGTGYQAMLLDPRAIGR